MKYETFEPRFVDSMPSDLEQGVIYVCIKYRTSAHLCACGCGNRVTTPIRPPRWHLTYDGDSVSLYPSVGSWQFPCRSHYWIKHNRVKWSLPWTDEQIAKGRASDAKDMRLYYETEDLVAESMSEEMVEPEMQASMLRRLLRRFRN